ncbi:MAG: hypothetical protein QXS83_01090 [Thermoplasmata archaeon]
MSQKGNKELGKEDRRLLERGMKFVSEIEKYIRRDVGRMQEDAGKEKKGRGRPHNLQVYG